MDRARPSERRAESGNGCISCLGVLLSFRYTCAFAPLPQPAVSNAHSKLWADCITAIWAVLTQHPALIDPARSIFRVSVAFAGWLAGTLLLVDE